MSRLSDLTEIGVRFREIVPMPNRRYFLLSLVIVLLLPGRVRASEPELSGFKRPAVPAVPEKFRHPGLLDTLPQLRAVRKKIEAGEEPWKSAFLAMKNSKWAALNYKPKPHEIVSSGFFGAGGSAGGSYDQNDDAIAAYTQALMWIFTDDERYAQKAVEILNAWSILKSHEGPNWYMMAQWTGSIFPQGAELIRATYPGWKAEDIARFSQMLSDTYLTILHHRMSYGNRHFGVINALLAIGVFNNDRAAVAEGLHRWVSYVPSWIYLKEDGLVPVKPDYWLTWPTNEEMAEMDKGLFPDVSKSWIFAEDRVKAFMKEKKLGDDHTAHEKYDAGHYWYDAPPDAYVNGLCAETFRDLGHCDLGFSQMINSAEIAWHQGIDLYGIYAKRITAFMEFYADLTTSDTIPKVFYSVQPTGMLATFEIAYNHYHNRMGMDLPKTKKLIDLAIRPCLQKEPHVSPGWSSVPVGPGVRASHVNYPADLATAWETLTHAEIGDPKDREVHPPTP
ncbi:alginate lyase family protein [soil metagenome]